MRVGRLNPSQGTRVRAEIRRVIESKGYTNEMVAGFADCDESTVRKLRGGKTNLYATFQKVCRGLNLDLESILKDEITSSSHAPAIMGGYRLPIFSFCVGDFVTIRPSIQENGMIERYITSIFWNEPDECLSFIEGSPENEKGNIYIPPSSAFLYLVTIRDGYVRTVVASTMHNKDKFMLGTEIAQVKMDENKAGYVPIVRPIAYLKDEDHNSQFSMISSKDKYFEDYQRLLTQAEGYITKINVTHK